MHDATPTVRHLVKISAILVGILAANHFQWTRLEWHLFEQKSYWKTAAFVIVWMVSVTGPMAAAYSPRTGTRWVYGILLPLLNMANDIHFRIMGEGINLTVLEKVINNLQLTGQVGVPYLHVVWTPAASAALMGFGIVLSPKTTLPRVARVGEWWPVFAGLLASVPIAQNLHHTDGWPGYYVTPTCLVEYVMDRPNSRREEVSLPLTASGRQATHLVLIIDESVRGDFIDLNGEWDTTPWLKAQRGIVNFGLSTAARNCSAESNLVLRSGANPRQLYQKDRTILNNPSIWKYARLAGYRSVYIDGQMPQGRLHSYMTFEEEQLIDEFVYMSTKPIPAYGRDVEAAKLVQQYLRSSTPTLVILNKYGIHFHYEHSYPQGQDVFRPHLDANEFPVDRTRMVNSYRNAARWAVDHFLRTLLEGADLSRSVIIYTSDHGQNLLEDGKPATHCRVQNPTPQEAIVPLLVFTRMEALRMSFQAAADTNRNRTSHFQIFPTLLILMGYRPEDVVDRYYLSLLDSVTEELGFLSGGAFRDSKWNRIDVSKHATGTAEESRAGGTALRPLSPPNVSGPAPRF